MRHSEEEKGKFCIGSNDIRATCQMGAEGEPLLTSGKQELYEA